MHKKSVKRFMIIGIAGVLSLLFIEWSRWNLIPLSEKSSNSIKSKIIMNQNL